MALLSGFTNLAPSTDTFADWLNKTNEIIVMIRGAANSDSTNITSVMTANSQVGGSQTFGNSTLFGQFSANAMVVFNNGLDPASNAISNGEFGGLRGGTWNDATNTISTDTLYVVSNTTYTDETVEVYVNSTYGLIVENNIEARYDVLFVGNSGSNTDPQMHWESDNNTLNLNDDVKATFGDGDDLQIWHDGNDTWIRENASGNLYVESTNMILRATDGSRYLEGIDGTATIIYSPDDTEAARANNDQFHITDLANTNTLRVRNTSLFEDDIDIEGSTSNPTLTWDKSANTLNFDDDNYITLGTDGDLSLHHDGTDTIIENSTGELYVKGDGITLRSTTDEEYITADLDGSVTLYANNVARLTTTFIGVDIEGEANTDTLRVQSTANFEGDIWVDGSTSSNELHWHKASNTLHMADNVKLVLGDHTTFEMYHEGSNTYLTENGSGDLVLQANNVQIEDTSGQAYFCGFAGLGASVHYNGTQKLITTASGIDVTGLVLTDTLQVDGNVDLGSSNADTISILAEFDTALIPAVATANVGSEACPWDWGYFNDLNVANTATILNLEVTSLEANGVAFTGTGDDVTTTSATIIDSFPIDQTQGFKFFIHGENLNDADSGYVVEINCMVTDNGDVYYTRYGEIENNMADVTIVPSSNSTYVNLDATCLSASGTDIHRFKVLKIETRAS